MKRIGKGKLAGFKLTLLLSGILLASFAMAQVSTPRYVSVTFYFDDSGSVVGAESWGDCDLGSWGSRTGSSTTQVYDCDGELPY